MPRGCGAEGGTEEGRARRARDLRAGDCENRAGKGAWEQGLSPITRDKTRKMRELGPMRPCSRRNWAPWGVCRSRKRYAWVVEGPTPADHGSGRASRADTGAANVGIAVRAEMTPSGQVQQETRAPLPLLLPTMDPGASISMGPSRASTPACPAKAGPFLSPQVSLPTSPNICFPGPQLGSSEGLLAPQHPHASSRAGERRNGRAASPTGGRAPRHQEHLELAARVSPGQAWLWA